MSFYQNYSDKDLIAAYNTMMEYSGKASEELLAAIDQRGGMDAFLHGIEQQAIYQREVKRITAEVYALSPGVSDVDFIRKKIRSTILSKEDIDDLVQTVFMRHQRMLADRKITSKTIIGSLAGAIVSSVLTGVLWGLSIIYSGNYYFFLLIAVYLICYFIIKLVTKQSRNNAVVFIASFLATAAAFAIGLLLVHFHATMNRY